MSSVSSKMTFDFVVKTFTSCQVSIICYDGEEKKISELISKSFDVTRRIYVHLHKDWKQVSISILCGTQSIFFEKWNKPFDIKGFFEVKNASTASYETTSELPYIWGKMTLKS